MKLSFRCLSLCLLALLYLQVHGQQLEVQEVLTHVEDGAQSISLDESSIKNQVAQKKSSFTLPFLNAERSFQATEFSMWGNNPSPYKDIKTYRLHDPTNGQVDGRLLVSDNGIYITYFVNKKMIRYYSELSETGRQYYREVGVKKHKHDGHTCAVHGTGMDYVAELKEEYNPLPRKRNGSVRRVYRTAVVLTGEYIEGNGTLLNAITLATANLMDISAIFERELNIEMNHILRSPYRNFSDSTTDPFDPNGDARPTQAGNAVAGIWSTSEYDIGHVFHKHSTGDGWGTGGVAGLGVVCREGGSPPPKARGWSGSFDNTTNSFVSLAAHEFGHMFNATHTFNGNGESCEDNISEVSSYEIGSGTTIMSYNGICGADQNITPSGGTIDDYFHVNSLDRMIEYVETFTCNEANWISDTNTPPVANADPCGINDFNLPKNTPFYLVGNGEDADGDQLTYCWEQYDEDDVNGTPTQGRIGQQASFSRIGPNFRSFPPTSDPVRYFPRKETLVAGAASDPFEALPFFPRGLTFRLTVRDNNPNGGGVNWDQINIAVADTGPLQIEFPNSDDLVAGEPITVEWSTGGSDDLCSNVTISASFDGGLNFPYVLAENVDYSTGSFDLTVPEGFPDTETARFKIECTDSDCFRFYDISDRDFNIESSCTATNSVLCDTEFEEFNRGDRELDLGLETTTGIVSGSLNKVLEPSGTMIPGFFNQNGDCTRAAGVFPNNPFELIEFQVSESGTYTLNYSVNANEIPIYSIHEVDGFDRNDPCRTFITSTHMVSSAGVTTTSRGRVSAFLQGCTPYYLIPHVNIAANDRINFTSISGPGLFIRPLVDDDYAETVIAIDRNTGEIIAQDPASDFSDLEAGDYTIRSTMYKAAGMTPPDIVDPDDWIGQTFSDIQSTGGCFSSSFNQKDITVISTCNVQDLDFRAPSPCDPATNTYSQRFSFSVDMGPTSGTVTINGQTFNVRDQEITVELEDLPADGQPVDLTFEFSEDSDCDKVIEDAFIAPESCCPIDIGFGDQIDACAGDEVELDGGEDASTYTWFLDNSEINNNDRILTIKEAGVYRVISDNGVCTKEQEVTVTFNEAPTLSAVSDVSGCDGNPEIVNVTSTADSIVWIKDGDVVADNATEYGVTESGSYVVKAVNEFGCETMAEFSASFAESPIVDLGVDESLCENTPKELNAGDPDNDYEWSLDGNRLSERGNILDATANGSGEYTVISTNAGNCSTRDTITITFRDLPELDLGSDIVGCQGDDLILSVDAQGFKVEWLLDNDIIADEEGNEITALVEGEYIARVSAGADCETADTIIVKYNPAPVVDLGPDRSACPVPPLELNGGSADNTYEWSSENQGGLSITDNVITVTESDTYYVLVTNADNCSSRDTVVITYEDLPDLELGPDLMGCEGDNLQLEVDAGGFIVEWSLDNDVIVGQSGNELIAANSGQYIAKVSSGPDCEESDTITVIYEAAPVVDLGMDRSSCPDKPIDLDGGDAGNTYEWSSESQGDLTETSNVLSVQTTDTYYVRSTNAANCSTLDTVTITFTDLPQLELGVDIEKCEGEEHIIVANNEGFEIEWQLNSNAISGQVDSELTVTESGIYTAKVSADATCFIEDEVTVTFNPVPVVMPIGDASPCVGDMVDLVAGADGEYDYTWRRDGDIIQEGDQGTYSVNDLDGSYTVTATNEFMCSTVDTAIIEYLETPMIMLPQDFDFCQGTDTLIMAEANAFIEWYYNGAIIPNQSGLTISANQGGEYVAVVGAGGSCERRDTITLNQIEAPDYELLGENQYCASDPNAVLSIALDVGESADWRLNGTSQQGGELYSISESGTYSVVVSNSAGCSTEKQLDVEFFALATNAISMVPQLCEGDVFSMTADSDGVTYAWTKDGVVITGEESLAIDLTESGDYEFVAYNAIGCETISPFSVVFDPVPIVDLGDDTRSECIGFSVLLEAPTDAGNTYVWTKDGVVDPSQTGPSYEILEDGVYGVSVTNSFGCMSEDVTTVTFNLPPSLSVSTPDETFCEGESTDLAIDTDANIIRWILSGSEVANNEAQINVSQGGIYTVEVESDDGCVISDIIEVEEKLNPEVTIDNVELCVGESQTIEVDDTFTSYEWTGITASGSSISIDYQDVTSNTTETASLTVIDEFGCTSTTDFDITYFALIMASAIDSPQEICLGENVQLSAEGGLNYMWDDPNNSLSASDISSPVATPTETTIYTVTVSDDCPNNFESFDIEVIVNPLPVADAGIDTSAISGIDMQLNATGGVAYSWTPSNVIQGSQFVADPVINIADSTTFTVVVTDENGCTDSDEVFVDIDDSPIEPIDVITPNDDGMNDFLYFRGLEAFVENELTIFNSWGNVVFKKKGYQIDPVRWDGTRNGDPLPAGTYYYILKFGDLKFKNSLTILRD